MDEILKKVEIWLANPANATSGESDNLLIALQKAMQENPEAKKSLGPLIGKIKSTENALREIQKISWVNVEKGNLAIGHRPGAKLMSDLRLYQTTHILTLLSEKEGGKKTESMAQKQGIGWLWFPMESAKPPTEARHQQLADLFANIKSILNDNGKIYIHCSAGIHRTGMISYALLRFLGYREKETIAVLAQLRDKTSEGVGEERVEWAESITDKLIKLSKK